MEAEGPNRCGMQGDHQEGMELKGVGRGLAK